MVRTTEKMTVLICNTGHCMSLAGNAYAAAEKVWLRKLTGLMQLVKYILTMYLLAVIQYIVPWYILYVI